MLKWDFFIAYAGPDEHTAEVLYDALQPHSRPFLASRNLLLGDDWDAKSAEAQRESLVTVVLVSDNSDNSDKAYYQREEIAAGRAVATAGLRRPEGVICQ